VTNSNDVHVCCVGRLCASDDVCQNGATCHEVFDSETLSYECSNQRGGTFSATPPCQQGVSSVLMRMEQRRRRLGDASENDVVAESPPSKCPLNPTIPRFTQQNHLITSQNIRSLQSGQHRNRWMHRHGGWRACTLPAVG